MQSEVDDLLRELDDLAPPLAHTAPPGVLRSQAPGSTSGRGSLTAPPAAQASATPFAQRLSSMSCHKPNKSTDVDNLIRELDLDSLLASSSGRANAGSYDATQQTSPVSPLHKSPSLNRSKCTVLTVGGSECARGRSMTSAGAEPRCCDNPRCTKCDFKVIWFPERSWMPDCDYMFFRNCYPTQDKLAAKLQPQAGTCAYCCQCTWLEASGTGRRLGPDVRWTCGGHDTGSSPERRNQIATVGN